MKTYFGFKNGKLVTVVQTRADNYEDAIDVDYTVENPNDAESQIARWKAS